MRKSTTLLFTLFFYSLVIQAKESKIDKLIYEGYKIQRIKKNLSPKEASNQVYKSHKKFSYLTPENFEDLFFRWNPHIKNLSNIKGRYIYTDSPLSAYLMDSHPPSLDVQLDDFTNGKFVEIKKNNLYEAAMGKVTSEKNKATSKRTPASEPTVSKRSFVGFFHVTMSQGNFSEQIQSASVDNSQNSPFTVGAGGVYLFDNDLPYSLSSSFYLSKISNSSIDENSQSTVQTRSLSIPYEIGVNLYAQRNLSGYFSNIYGGFDVEKFSTLNFTGILFNNETDLLPTEEQMTFLTIGTSLQKNIFLPTMFKISLSQSIQSKTDLKGYRYLLYMNQKITQRFWYHLLYKGHELESDIANRKVSIARYGIGVGMAF